jgi:hypothetical protein
MIIFDHLMQLIMAIMVLVVIICLRDLTQSMNDINRDLVAMIENHEDRLQRLEYHDDEIP